MARPSKEHILSEIRRLAAENGGVPIGVERFEVATGIRDAAWQGVYWARWGEAVLEAGFQPNTLQAKKYSDEELIQFLANVTRDLGHLPTVPDLRMRKRADPTAPSHSVFQRRLGTTGEILAKVSEFAKERDEYADVASILAARASGPDRRPQRAESAKVVTGAVYLVRMAEFYKIGRSNDPGRRLYEVGLRLPEKHDVIHVIETDDPSGIEAYWHRRFAANRANGEWFRLSPDDVAAFCRRAYM